MTTIVEHYDTAGDTPDTGTVRFWPPQERPAAHGPGRISTAALVAPLSNGDLSVVVEPGLTYVQEFLSGGKSDAVLVNVPDSPTPVRLSTLVPQGLPPATTGLLTTAQLGAANGVASLGANGLVPTSELPASTPDIAYDTDGVPYLLI